MDVICRLTQAQYASLIFPPYVGDDDPENGYIRVRTRFRTSHSNPTNICLKEGLATHAAATNNEVFNVGLRDNIITTRVASGGEHKITELNTTYAKITSMDEDFSLESGASMVNMLLIPLVTEQGTYD